MASIFTNSFFSIAGQKERISNVAKTLTTVTSNIVKTVGNAVLPGTPFKTEKISATPDFKGTALGTAAEYVANNPIKTAVAVGTAANVVKLGISGSTAAVKEIAVKSVPVVSNTVKAAVKNPVVQKVGLTTGAIALTAPALLSAQNIGTTTAFALNPIAAGAGTVYNLASGELERQKEIFKESSTEEKVKQAAIDIGIGSTAIGLGAVIYKLWNKDNKLNVPKDATLEQMEAFNAYSQALGYVQQGEANQQQAQQLLSSPVTTSTPVLSATPQPVTPAGVKKKATKKKKKTTKKKTPKKKAKKKTTKKKTTKKKKSLNTKKKKKK